MDRYIKLSKNWEVGIYKTGVWTFAGFLRVTHPYHSYGIEKHNSKLSVVFPKLKLGFRRTKRLLHKVWKVVKDPKFYLKQFFKQLLCKHDIQHYRGYPGEHIYGCQKCGKVFDYDFNIGEVI